MRILRRSGCRDQQQKRRYVKTKTFLVLLGMTGILDRFH